MTSMLGIEIGREPLPAIESREAFIEHYGSCASRRLTILQQKPDDWFEEDVAFFEVRRSRAWVLTRRFLHSAHHRAQLTAAIRAWGRPLYSTYGPTADTGGLPTNGGRTIYPSAPAPELPGPGPLPPTERPDGETR
jgi:hypothetical protein